MNLLLDISSALLPEFNMVLLIIICLILSLILKKEQQNLVYSASIGGLLCVLVSFTFIPKEFEMYGFYGSFVSDSFTILFRFLIVLGAIFTVLLSRKYACNFGKSIGEFYTLILIATLGAMLLAGANDLIMIFIALETLSLSSFALCGFTRQDKSSNEAALKYLIIGSAASAVMLWGMSFLYGLSAETNITSIASYLSVQKANLVLIISFLFVFAGFGYKISAVPFHVWAPDVYQGSPVPVAAYLSVVSKIAGFAALIRVMLLIYSNIPAFSAIIALIAIITMTAGNLMALGQKNIRRLMAYSSIAQAGYILLGLVVLTQEGISGMIFYSIAYLFMNFGVWAAIEIFAIMSGLEKIDDYNGLAHKNRYFSLCMTICLLSLAGIPLTAGFFAKFYLFKAVLFAGFKYLPLLAIALVNTVIAVFYYVKIIKAMYVLPCAKFACHDGEIRISYSLQAVLAIAVLGTLLIGIFAGTFIDISKAATSSLESFF